MWPCVQSYWRAWALSRVQVVMLSTTHGQKRMQRHPNHMNTINSDGIAAT
jgi:hypothetical protein